MREPKRPKPIAVDRRAFLKTTGVLAGSAMIAGAGLPGCDDAPSDGGEGGSGGGGAPGRYNLLLVTADQLRTFELQPADVTLPAIQSLLDRGFSFTGHHIASAVCTPARSALYTGRHAPTTKMTDNINFAFIQDLDPAIPTLGTALQSMGWYPAYKGKWHLSKVGPESGDRDCAQSGPTTDALEPYGFHDFNDCGDEHGKMLSGATTDADTADAAIDWLANKAPTLDRPWCLAVNFVNPHDVMFFDTDGVGPRGSTQQSETGIPLAPAPARDPYSVERVVRMPSTLGASLADRPAGHADHKRLYDTMFGAIPADRPEMWRAYLSYYVNCQIDVDRQIQRVLDGLDESGLREQTIVVFVADHGEMGGAHGVRQKGPFIHRENTNVPLVIVHPALAGGVQVPALMSAVDLVPTLCSLLGRSADELKAAFPGLVGHDFAGLLEAPTDPGPRAGEGILFTYDGLSTVDVDFAIANAPGFGNQGSDCANGTIDLSHRGFVRAVYDGEHRLARWFAPNAFHSPADVAAMFAANDVELLRAGHGTESDTPIDAAAPENAAVLEALRAKLEALIARELGADGYEVPAMVTC